MKKRELNVDAIFCPSFGRRINEPSLSNKFLAKRIVEYYQGNPLPLIIQKDCADYCPADIEIDKTISSHVLSGLYLDTVEVVRQCAQYCIEHNLKKVLVFAHPDHLGRVKRSLKYFQLEYEVADTSACPYDPKSTQAWTRGRAIYFLREILVRIVLRLRGFK